MTLAELEMFINNMIDTSMSYKDTNGTKYTENDKVSGFSGYTSANVYDLINARSHWETEITRYEQEYTTAVNNYNALYAQYVYWRGNEAYNANFDRYMLDLLSNSSSIVNSKKESLGHVKNDYALCDDLIKQQNALKLKAKNIASSIFGNEQYGLKIKNIYTVYQTISDSAKQVAHRLEKLLGTKL